MAAIASAAQHLGQTSDAAAEAFLAVHERAPAGAADAAEASTSLEMLRLNGMLRAINAANDGPTITENELREALATLQPRSGVFQAELGLGAQLNPTEALAELQV